MAKPKKKNRGVSSEKRPQVVKATSPITDDVTKRIAEAIQPIIDNAGLYVENVSAKRAGSSRIVQVTLDLPWGPGGVDSDSLTEVSRLISHCLDDEDIVEGAYVLEVSTPGAERSLTQARHFSRAEGRLVSFQLKESQKLKARIKVAHSDSVVVETDTGERQIPLSDIERAKVEVEFSKIDD